MSDGAFKAAAFIASFGLYLLLAGSPAWTELVAGVAVSGAVAAFMQVQRLRRGRPLALPVPPARVLAGVATGLVADTVRVGAALLRAFGSRQAGTLFWQAFHPGGRRARDAGRRAAVTVLASLSPNGFVLDVRPSALPDADHGMLLHRLVPAPPSPDRDWPA